jgi:hypothetical protein
MKLTKLKNQSIVLRSCAAIKKLRSLLFMTRWWKIKAKRLECLEVTNRSLNHSHSYRDVAEKLQSSSNGTGERVAYNVRPSNSTSNDTVLDDEGDILISPN